MTRTIVITCTMWRWAVLIIDSFMLRRVDISGALSVCLLSLKTIARRFTITYWYCYTISDNRIQVRTTISILDNFLMMVCDASSYNNPVKDWWNVWVTFCPLASVFIPHKTSSRRARWLNVFLLYWRPMIGLRLSCVLSIMTLLWSSMDFSKRIRNGATTQFTALNGPMLAPRTVLSGKLSANGILPNLVLTYGYPIVFNNLDNY